MGRKAYRVSKETAGMPKYLIQISGSRLFCVHYVSIGGYMISKTYITIGLVLAITLVTLNMGFTLFHNSGTAEISVHEYRQIETDMSLYPEIAEATKDLVKHERVTVAEYNKIMRYSSEIKSRRSAKASKI